MKSREFFRNLAIRQKIQYITIATCTVVLVLALTAVFVSQIFNFRANYKRDTATLAGIVADNSTAALAFNDRKAASEIVASLKAKPNVLYACLLNAHEDIVADIGDPTAGAKLADYPPPNQFRVHGGRLLYSRTVMLDKKNIGRLYLCTDYQGVFLQLLRFYGLIMVLVLACSVFVTLLLSRWLGRVITLPVLKLAETARLVGEKQDYSVRSDVAGVGDEVGRLAGAFNHMLERIQHQDAALNLSQEKLESLVNSINGIVWEWDPGTATFTFVSQQCQSMLGFPPESWLANPKFWSQLAHPDDGEKAAGCRLKAIAGRAPYHLEYRMLSADGRLVWIRESGTVISHQEGSFILRGIFQDITIQKQAAGELEKLNRRLLETSRQAGMAEVATSVLHNVGNVLNSVNVSATVLHDQLTKSQLANLQRATGLLREHAGNLPHYLATDARGRLLPDYLIQLAGILNDERARWLEELKSLERNVEHIKRIVAMQQGFARVSGITELLDIRELVEDAIQINFTGLQNLGVEIIRDYEVIAPVLLDKHKIVQILTNVISNAKYALEQNPPKSRRLKIRIGGGEGRLRIAVQDNGVGIAKEDLIRIFGLGFTTKPDGHGFGLHSGALAAQELGGSLVAHSDGPGTGATFILELPTSNENGTDRNGK